MVKINFPRETQPPLLFLLPHQPFPHGMDEVRVGGLEPRCPKIRRDLPPVIGGMEEDLGQDVTHRVGPALPLRINVRDLLGYPGRAHSLQIIPPERRELTPLRLALVPCPPRP